MWRAVFLVLLTCGCVELRGVYVDADAPDTLVAAVADGVDAWNSAAGFPLLDARAVAMPRAGYLLPGSIVVVETAHLEGALNAYTLSGGIVTRIQVRAGLDPEFPLRWLLAHELGHALGLEHEDEPCNAMHDDWDPDDDCGEGELELNANQLRRVRGLGVAGMLL